MSIRLNGSTSGYTEIDAPAVAGSNTLVLPTGNGSSGQFLQTNGSGTLSWAGGGKILQVVSTTKTDTFSSTSLSLTDVTGLSVSITPSSTSNKVLITGSVCWSISDTTPYLSYFVLVRGSTQICIADAAGNRSRATFGSQGVYSTDNTPFAPLNFLDSPSSTSSVTYKIQTSVEGGRTVYVNRGGESDGDQSIVARFTSTITAMEVAA